MNIIIDIFDYLKTSVISIPLTLIISYGLYKVFRRKQPQALKQTEEHSDSESESSDASWMDEESYSKMVLVVRNDLKMGKGKVAAQCAHAAVGAYKEARKHKKLLKSWSMCGQTKITLRCDSEAEMLELHRTARAVGLLAYIVRDAGQTQVAPGSRTVLAVGPGPCEMIDQITGHLKLY